MQALSRFIALIAVACLCACASAPVVPPPSTGAHFPAPQFAQPHIILITAEDLSPRFGFMRDPVAVTPHLDALAAESVVFTRAFATAGVCAPARSALITGVHQTTLGTQHMRSTNFGINMAYGAPYEAVPPPEVKAFPELLRRAGYTTFNRQKTDYQFGEPFTVWDDDNRSREWPLTNGSEPFFAMINFPTTHEARTWPPDLQGEAAKTYRSSLERNAVLDASKTFGLTDPATVRVPAYLPDTPVVRANLARHYDNIRVMDGEVGALLKRLRDEGRFADSIIIFTTDHGDGLPRHKRTIFDSGLHVPLIVRFPDGFGAGTKRTDLASFVDFAPTILSLAGVAIPDWIQGRNLFGDPAPDAVFAAGDRFDEVPQRFRGVREERWHYVRYYGESPVIPSLGYQNVNPIMDEMRRLHAIGELNSLQGSYLEAPAPREYLFDTLTDPDEVNNLAQRPELAEVRDRLARKLDQWIVQSGDLGRMPESAMRAAMWPEGTQPMTSPVTGCRLKNGRIRLASGTPGASIAWGRREGRENLYFAPLTVGEPFHAMAIRYGYEPSTPIRVDPASLAACPPRD